MPLLFQRHRLASLFLLGGVISLVIGCIQLYPLITSTTDPVVVVKSNEKQIYQNINKESEIAHTISKVASESATIVVDVAGAVNWPGVYTLPKYSRINDALVSAGGISKKGDTGWVGKNLNLATRLEDGDKIFIPAIGEAKTGSAPTPLPVVPAATATASQESSPVHVAGISTDQPGHQKASPGAGAAAPSATPFDGKININTGTATELDVLPGVGAITAQKIIDNRPYTTIEELKEKKAVNKSTFEKIKDKIKL